jgi:hypothetical protein
VGRLALAAITKVTKVGTMTASVVASARRGAARRGAAAPEKSGYVMC